MAAVDAQFHWTSAKIPNDQFLLYAFAEMPTDVDAAIAEVLCRARHSPDLMMRVVDSSALRYPSWQPAAAPGAVIQHEVADDTWRGCLDAIVRLADDQVDARHGPWRLHLFTPVRGIPGSTGPGTVAVLQAAHALADGTRAAALAGRLFGRAAPIPAARRASGILAWRTLQAARAHHLMVADTRAGLLAPAPAPRPLLATNRRPAGVRAVRTLLRHRAQLTGPTVTVAVLAAVADALSAHLGEPADTLGAEVPMVKSGTPRAYNHFRNVSVGLYPQLPAAERAERIAADLAAARRRTDHPATHLADRAFAATPAPLLRWGIERLDPDARPERVNGNTVVSSVHRGAADLHFGGAPVLLTAGYPALSPVMGLTHGVHGIGDTVAISVHAAESAIGDVDEYVGRLDAALQ